MSGFFKFWSRKPGVATLVTACLCITGLALVLASPRSKSLRETIEIEATDAIDYEQLEQPLADFIELVKSHTVIDQPASDFKNVLKESIICFRATYRTTEEFSFVLPTTPEVSRRLKESHEVDSFPMLWVLIDKRTETIQRVLLYIQSL